MMRFVLLLAAFLSTSSIEVRAQPIDIDALLKEAQSDFKKPENRRKIAAGLLITYGLAEFVIPGKRDDRLDEKEIKRWNDFDGYVKNLKTEEIEDALANEKLNVAVKSELNVILPKFGKMAEALGVSRSSFYRELIKSIAITSVVTKLNASPIRQSICDNFYVGWVCKWL